MALIVSYLLIGAFVWSGIRVMNTAFFEQMANFVFTSLLWPLLFGLVLFYVLVIPAILCFIVALFLVQKRRYTVAASLFLTIFLLFSSLFLPITIRKQEDLSSVRMGLPVAFYVQDQSQYEPPLPWQTKISSANENPTTILWPQFGLSYSIVFALIWSIISVLTIFYHYRKHSHNSS